MGLWIGAAMDTPPHAVVVMNDGPTLRDHSFLRVNNKGARVNNEDISVDISANVTLMQQDMGHWQIIDADWPEYVFKGGNHLGRQIFDIEATKELVQADIDNGIYAQADSLEELAEKAGFPVNKFKATVERYNTLCEQGEDADFGVRSSRMFPVVKPPFLAGKLGILLYATLGGLRVNSSMQVLDKNLESIPGLYAAGNASGSFYGSEYYDCTLGSTLGRALTTGRALAEPFQRKQPPGVTLLFVAQIPV
jgi:fumarate reductase flavoprotein subunit